MYTEEILIKEDLSETNIEDTEFLYCDENLNVIRYCIPDSDDILSQFLDEIASYSPNAYDEELGTVSIEDENIPEQLKLLWSVGFPGLLFGNPLSSYFEYSGLINLENTQIQEYIYNLYAPVDVTFDPSYIKTDGKIYKIEYSLDGQLITQNFFPSNSSSEVLPISSEIGDPRNYKQTFRYTLDDELQKTILNYIKVYEYGNKNSRQILYTINLTAPPLEGRFGLFDEIHLIGNKLFDFDDKVLYMFESYNPQYVLPVVVNWNKTNNSVLLERQKARRYDFKRYRVLEPFEIQNNQNSNIKGGDFVENTSYLIDEPYHQTYNLLTMKDGYFIKTQSGINIRIGNYYNSNINKPQPPISK
jgi:hypothetical protein